MMRDHPAVKGKRALAGRMLGKIGLIGAIGALRPRLWRGITILAYHRVLDVADDDAFPFDLELVSASVDGFAGQMEHLRKHYQPITFATLLQHLDAGEAPPRGAAIVTFDDGFSDNYEHAFPVLRRLGIPATIFLATGYLDSQRTYWYEQVSHAVLTTRVEHVTLPGAGVIALGKSVAARRDVIKTLLKWLKGVPNATRLATIEDLRTQMGANGAPLPDRRSEPLTWEQVKEMSAAGIEFGSHTVSHPVLSMVEPQQLAHELGESKRRIEEVIGKPVHTLAYPVGGAEAFNDSVRAAVRVAGYRLGVSYISGVDTPGRWDPYAIRRLQIERYMDAPLFKATLALPEVFAY